MKAVVFHGIGDIRIDTVPDPEVTDAAVDGQRDLRHRPAHGARHPRRDEAGHDPRPRGCRHRRDGRARRAQPAARRPRADSVDDRMRQLRVLPRGLHRAMRRREPGRPACGYRVFGGPAASGAFNGLQAEYARTPLAHASLIRLPDAIDDDRAILMSDIFPTGYFGAQLGSARGRHGRRVRRGSGRPVRNREREADGRRARDRDRPRGVAPRDGVRAQGAEIVDFAEDDPVETVLRLTGGIGVDRVIDAVGVDAMRATHGPRPIATRACIRCGSRGDRAAPQAGRPQLGAGRRAVAGAAMGGARGRESRHGRGDRRVSAGVARVSGRRCDEPQPDDQDGQLQSPNGDAAARRAVRSGAFDPLSVLTRCEPLTNAIDAYRAFDTRASRG